MRHWILAMTIGLAAAMVTVTREASAITEHDMLVGEYAYRATWDCTVRGDFRDCRGFTKEFRADDDGSAASKFEQWWVDNHPGAHNTKLEIYRSPGRE